MHSHTTWLLLIIQFNLQSCQINVYELSCYITVDFFLYSPISKRIQLQDWKYVQLASIRDLIVYVRKTGDKVHCSHHELVIVQYDV